MTNFRDSKQYLFGLEGQKQFKKLLRDNGIYVLESDELTNGSLRIDGFCIPDFFTINNNSVFVEVKHKSVPSYHRITGKYEHGFGKRLHTHYLEISKRTGKEVWMVIIVESRNEILCFKIGSTPTNHEWCNPNRVQKGVDPGGMVYFAVEDMYNIDVLLDRIGLQ